MAINFIPNDPSASGAPPIRQQAKHANRPATRSDFTLSNASPEGVNAAGTPAFLFWQCREAALRAVAAWEASAGPHKKWHGNRRKMRLLQDEGQDLNAYYNRTDISFFHENTGADTIFTGASTDVVSHEVGHGLLDAVRPDLWDTNFAEVDAFHEAFGDCIAVLTALGDKASRLKLLAVTPTLRKKNFVETLMEDLARGTKLLYPGDNSSEPRHALNKHKYQLPQSLPNDGPPGALINEFHSFAMVFTGCFWDLIARLFAAGARTEAGLSTAATTAGGILIAALKGAVVTPRFFQSVGRAMVLADDQMNGSANRDRIRAAFQAHDIQLGANAILAPSMALAGSIGRGAALGPAARKDLMTRLGAKPGAKLSVAKADVFGTPMMSAVHTREVPLGSIDSRLKGVVALGHEPVLVARSGMRAAIMGALPNQADTEEEVRSFVETLLANDEIDVAPTAGRRSGVAAAAPMRATRAARATHAVVTVGGKKVLRRVCFRC